VALYALSSVDGPPLGNALSGYIAQEKGWRWLFWFYLIVFGATWVILAAFLPETRDTISKPDQVSKGWWTLADVQSTLNSHVAESQTYPPSYRSREYLCRTQAGQERPWTPLESQHGPAVCVLVYRADHLLERRYQWVSSCFAC
jgi:hypothetical protein